VSLKLRAALFVTVLVAGVVFLLTAFHVYRLWHDLMASESAQQFATVTRVAAEIDHKLGVRQQALLNEARSVPPARLADPAWLGKLLAERGSLHALFDTLFVISAQGRIVADHPEVAGRRGRASVNPDFIARIVASGAPQVSRPFLGSSSGNPLVAVGVPIHDDSGSVAAVLVGSLNLVRASFLGRVGGMGLGKSGHFSILARDGSYVMHPERTRILKSYEEFEGRLPAFVRALSGVEGSSEHFDREGRAMLYSFKQLERADWLLVASLPSEEAFASVIGVQRKMMWSSLAIALLIPGAIWIMIRNLLRPLDRLRAAIRAVRDDPSRRADIAIGSNDEIGQVAREFARMHVRLRWRARRQRRSEAALRESEAHQRRTALDLEAIFENASVGIAFSRNRVIERSSAAFDEIFGYPPGELEGKPGLVVWPSAGEYAAVGREAGPLLIAGRPYEAERQARRKDGSRFWARIRAKAVKAGDPSKGTIWIIEDISEKRQAEERLFAAKERAHATLLAIGDAVIVTDAEGRVELMNPLAEALTGRALAGSAGQPLADVLALCAQDGGAAPDPIGRVLANEGRAAEGGSGAIRGAGGRTLTIEYSAAPIRNLQQRVDGVVIAFRDVTSERAMAEQVSWQATHDALTSLINRREFERRLERALAGARDGRGDHTALLLDLDQFKIVNDTCGHAAGDELLRQITFELSNRIRLTDTLARLGGDEFGVLLEGCRLDQGVRIAESIRQAVEDFRFSWQDKVFKVGVSVGAVAVNPAYASLADIMKAADAACYMAKEMGRNRIHVHSPNDGELAQRHGEMEWVSRIHKALEEDRLALYYQEIRPVTGSQNGDHFELLLRMIDEKGRMVSPLTFLPAAERYHLMPAIDRWVVRTALARFRALYGPTGTRRLHTAAINLSGASITDENFVRYVQGLFKEYRVPPRSICFEITETTAIGSLRLASEFMKQLKALGCRFSLDDFGSGMSSFAYLKNLPVDFLKIDGGFVKDMERDPIDCAMVEAIHRVGHVMGIKTVAEFVENEAILERLAAIGVDYAQGYGVARPRPLEDLGGGSAARPAAERKPRLTVVAA